MKIRGFFCIFLFSIFRKPSESPETKRISPILEASKDSQDKVLSEPDHDADVEGDDPVTFTLGKDIVCIIRLIHDIPSKGYFFVVFLNT